MRQRFYVAPRAAVVLVLNADQRYHDVSTSTANAAASHLKVQVRVCYMLCFPRPVLPM